MPAGASITSPLGRELSGTVTAFDEARGTGWIDAADGLSFPFHCTSIDDGTRSIAVGTPVLFRVAAGLPGRYEAVEVTRLGGASPAA